MLKPEFIIHVGPHKTGSTYLQNGFLACQSALAEHGILYPPTLCGAPARPGHAALPLALRHGDDATLSHALDGVIAAGAERVLLSAEDMSTLDDTALARLRSMLDGHHVRVVFYVRRWSEIVPSVWQERVKHGQAATLPEFVASLLRDVRHAPLLNIDHALAALGRYFGPECVTLIGHSECRDSGRDLFGHFTAEILSIPSLAWQGAGSTVNASRDMATIEILRVFNSLSRREGLRPQATLRVAFDRMPDSDALLPVRQALERHRQIFKWNDRWPELQALHASLVHAYRDHMRPPSRPARLFKPETRELEYADPAYLLEPGVADILRELHQSLIGAAPPPSAPAKP